MGNCIATNKVANLVSNYGFGKRTPEQSNLLACDKVDIVDIGYQFGIQVVVGDGEPTIVEESEPVPPNAEETFILDLSPIIEIQPVSSLVEPAVTGAQKRGLKRPLPNNNDDAYELLLKRETERAEAQILLAEEQIKLTKLQQTKAKLQIRLLKTAWKCWSLLLR
ncbi:uncharacterized protein LOC107710894 [Tachysurus ichikawai]